MKNLIIKADRATLNILTKYVRRWVEWHDEEKHAIDFMIRWEWVQLGALVVWAIVIPAALYVLQGDIAQAGIHVAIWSALAVMEWFGIQMTVRKVKPYHDFIWGMRKNPEFVAMHKQMLEELFVKMRRKRLETSAMMVGITVALFAVFMLVTTKGDPNMMVWQYLFANTIANTLKRYLLYVDDMTQPKKEKKASHAISELLQRMWGELVGGFEPQPAYAGV